MVEFYIESKEGLEILYKTLYEGKPILHTEASNYLNDTLSVENENNKSVKKIIIVKNKGIVSYTTADGKEWKLVE
jgi:proline dehydrogenase